MIGTDAEHHEVHGQRIKCELRRALRNTARVHVDLLRTKKPRGLRRNIDQHDLDKAEDEQRTRKIVVEKSNQTRPPLLIGFNNPPALPTVYNSLLGMRQRRIYGADAPDRVRRRL